MSNDSVIGNNQFTCITCRVAFRNLEVQRLHYKSDWHRYNLKRKVAELPPITSDEFQNRVLAHQANDIIRTDPIVTQCKLCHKSFNSKNQYDNHLMSKKHRDNELKYNIQNQDDDDDDDNDDDDDDDNDMEASSSDTGSWTLLPPNVDEKNKTKQLKTDETVSMDTEDDVKSVDSNDDEDEDEDEEENPVENNNCLFCNHHSRSWFRNLKHMTNKHSFFLADFEYCIDPKGLLEYLGEKVYIYHMCIWCNDTGKLFDSADAARAHMIDKGHCKMLHEGETLAEYADYYDYASGYPDADEHDPDEEVDVVQLNDDDYQLVLPSGNVIGHRSLMRYYKQSFNPNSAVAIPKSEKLRRVLCHYRALGWTGSEKEQIVKKARDIKYMQRIQSKYSTKLQFKANKFQKHYREQVNF